MSVHSFIQNRIKINNGSTLLARIQASTTLVILLYGGITAENISSNRNRRIGDRGMTGMEKCIQTRLRNAVS